MYDHNLANTSDYWTVDLRSEILLSCLLSKYMRYCVY